MRSQQRGEGLTALRCAGNASRLLSRAERDTGGKSQPASCWVGCGGRYFWEGAELLHVFEAITSVQGVGMVRGGGEGGPAFLSCSHTCICAAPATPGQAVCNVLGFHWRKLNIPGCWAESCLG